MAGAASNRMIHAPRMSVVVASHNARVSIRECLSVLVGQRNHDDVEILVVDNSHDGSAETASAVDWAVYFCRYSQYMLPFERGPVREIAGDNASYKRTHIERYRHVWRNGFWELAIHAELRKAGLPLLLVPSVVVFHHRSFGL